ncbi:MAG: HAMP domain-containing sensor histidine kinase [Clostridiales bacterium]|nr:HAMP domain-containing sensor histidine kinase [Clostridiales bacterium]
MRRTKKPLGKLHRRNLETLACLVAFLFLCLSVSIGQLKKIQLVDTENQYRTVLNQYVVPIEQGNYVACEYPYVIVTTAGDVVYENKDVFQLVGHKVNVNEILTMDESFIRNHDNYTKVFFTVNQGDTIDRFIVFLVPLDEKKDQVGSKVVKAMVPMIVGTAISVSVFAYQMLSANRKVLHPIEEISDSAKAIINGDYGKEVLRVYDTKVQANEVGDLTYSFELMRDELKAKQIKEEQLKKAQQELISCISHDLKTPLSTIKAYSEGLRDGIARTKEDKEEYVQIIIEKTNLLTTMISELLEYSNAQLKQMDIKKEEIYLADYFTPVLKELEIYVKQNDMEFSSEVMEENPILTIDPKRITEVLYNLIENSMKYRREEKAKVLIKVSRTDKQVLVRVIDNGIGINANDIPYVFDKFYRAEKSRSSNIPGSGLGLSICKYIVEQHNGEIYCKNISPSGCEFGFTIN